MTSDPGRPEFDRYARQYEELLRDPIRDRFAGDSDFFMARKWDLLEAFLRRDNPARAGGNWLDVGCGKGDLLRLGKHDFARAAGCDLSAEMLQACAGLDVRQQMEPGRLPFEANGFDLVTAVCVYHHVPLEQRAELTREVLRVVKPGGVACIIEHNPFNPATQTIVRRTPVDADAKLLTAGAARRLLARAGFAILRTEYFLYFPKNLYRRFAGLEAWLSRVAAGGQYAVFARKSASD